MQQGFCRSYHDGALFSSSRSVDSRSILLSIFWDQGCFECPQTGIGLNSSVHSTGSILVLDGKNGGNSEMTGGNLAVIGGKNEQSGGNSLIPGGNNEGQEANMDSRDNKILAVIIGEMKKDPSITIKAISEKHAIPQRTVERAVKQLREDGRIIRHGATHGGYWITAES